MAEDAWRPRELSFGRFEPGRGTTRRPIGRRKPLVTRLTKDIVLTYRLCNPTFKYSESLNPKKYLTSPHNGVSNEGYDNENSDLVLSVNLELINEQSQQRYIVKDMLGQGTFGQVAKCWMPDTNMYVAVKVIKNQAAYYQQAVHEVNILKTLNQNFDPDENHLVRMLDFFMYRSHLCISFEMLGSNLYELLKKNNLKGLPLSLVQMFSKQILHGLVIMKYAGIIHCDLKPENILLWTNVKPPGIKIIDFGSACKENQTVYSYIQSRYYRSPEVLLGYPYTTAIDMWSFGCIIAELFLGLPLFPGASEYDLLKRMIDITGGQPPDCLLRDAKKTMKFFKHVGSIHHLDGNEQCSVRAYHLLTEAEYEAKEHMKPSVGKWYFSHVKLDDIVSNYPYRRNLPEEEISKEKLIRMAMLDFIRGLIEFDPLKRWTPLQACRHPFVTGEPFTEPYHPPPVIYHNPGIPNLRVDHGPEQGHWLASGLSPQVSNMGRGFFPSSPHVAIMHLSHGGGYGSWGSYGSYSDNACPGTSFGDTNIPGYYSFGGPSGLSIPKQFGRSKLGSSPDARAIPQYSYGTGLGMSPSGTFRPMSLGASPSQFTPPSSQGQVSNISPGKYGPTSPAKGGSYSSTLGKAAAVAQYNKRRNWGHQGSFPFHHPESSSQHSHVHHFDSVACGGPEQNSQGLIPSPRGAQLIPSTRWNERGSGEPTTRNILPIQQNVKPSHPGNSTEARYPSESSSGKPESSSSLDPGDWDPNYSDDLLLQEDSLDTSSMVSGINNLHLNVKMDPAIPGVGSGRDRRGGYCQTRSNTISLDTRINGQHQIESNSSRQPSFHEIHPGSGYNLPINMPHHMAHHAQSSPSRFAQQPTQQINPTTPSSVHPDRNCQRGQSVRPHYGSEDPQASQSIAFRGVTTWGQQAGHPIAAVLPSYRTRNDYGRIS